MGKLYLISGMVLIGIVLLTGKYKINDYLAQTKGEIVTVTLIEIPEVKSRRGTWVDFQYQNQTHRTKLFPWSELQHYEEGIDIPMKHLPGSETFIPMGYSARGQLIAVGIVLLIGSYCIYKGIKALRLT